jgi:hypothetical protein
MTNHYHVLRSFSGFNHLLAVSNRNVYTSEKRIHMKKVPKKTTEILTDLSASLGAKHKKSNEIVTLLTSVNNYLRAQIRLHSRTIDRGKKK